MVHTLAAYRNGAGAESGQTSPCRMGAALNSSAYRVRIAAAVPVFYTVAVAVGAREEESF